MTNFADFGAVGSVALKKTAGSGPFSNATQIGIPVAMCQPINPLNLSYPGVINASSNLSTVVKGNKTPAVTIRTYMKASWCTANLINSLVLYQDATTLLTDEWAIQIKSQYKTRVFSLAKCAGIVFTQSSAGGPVVMDMSFIAIYGTDYSGSDENGSPVSFSAVSTDAGQLVHKGQVTWGGSPTADQVKGHTLALSRVQAYQFGDDGTLYAQAITSGAFGGALTLGQSPTNTVTPTSAATIAYGGTGAGITAALTLNLDQEYVAHDVGFLAMQKGYTLANLSTGGIPVVITAL